MLTNFSGRSAKVNSKVQISVRLRHFDQAKRVRAISRKRPYKAFFKICHCEKPIEKQSSKRCGFLIVHARVPIPRKGSFRLRLCAIMTNVADIEPLSTSPLGANPHDASLPRNDIIVQKALPNLVTCLFDFHNKKSAPLTMRGGWSGKGAAGVFFK